jgi:hypothetical protein
MAADHEPFGTPTPYAEPLWYSRGLSLHYSDSHRRLRREVRRYMDEEILPFAEEWERDGKVPESVSGAFHIPHLPLTEDVFGLTGLGSGGVGNWAIDRRGTALFRTGKGEAEMGNWNGEKGGG